MKDLSEVVVDDPWEKCDEKMAYLRSKGFTGISIFVSKDAKNSTEQQKADSMYALLDAVEDAKPGVFNFE